MLCQNNKLIFLNVVKYFQCKLKFNPIMNIRHLVFSNSIIDYFFLII